MAGGGFGRRAIPTSDYVVEACGIAKAARAADDPVRFRIVAGRNAGARIVESRDGAPMHAS